MFIYNYKKKGIVRYSFYKIRNKYLGNYIKGFLTGGEFVTGGIALLIWCKIMGIELTIDIFPTWWWLSYGLKLISIVLIFSGILFIFDSLKIYIYDIKTEQLYKKFNLLKTDNEKLTKSSLIELLTIKHKDISRKRAYLNKQILLLVKNDFLGTELESISNLIEFYSIKFRFMKYDEWQKSNNEQKERILKKLLFGFHSKAQIIENIEDDIKYIKKIM